MTISYGAEESAKQAFGVEDGKQVYRALMRLTKAPDALTFSGDQTNLDLSVASRHVHITTTESRAIHGIAAGVPGQEHILANIGASSFTIENESASATGSQVITSSGGTLTFAANGTALLWWDSNVSKFRALSLYAGYAP